MESERAVQKPNVLPIEQSVGASDWKRFALILAAICLVNLVGAAFLAHYLLLANQRLDAMTRELDILRTHSQAIKDKQKTTEEAQLKLDYKVFASVTNTLELTTQMLKDELKKRSDKEENEKLASIPAPRTKQ